MDVLEGALLAAYYAALGGLAFYGLHRLALAWISLRRRAEAPPAPGPLPSVTVQLPVFNEIYVLDRLVEAACALRYPRHLLEIQILDDSTDGTAARARALAREWRLRGFDVVCLHREDRAGFKAGALAAGLRAARGEFIAIFDADFAPPPDFLEKTLPHFADPGVGMVQARWGHLNRDYSLLTRAQALLLDGHFVVEQAARAASGRWFNFNGTAGIFRRTCIEDAGGWQTDTLTEDLDLSYRAQMAGWRFVFVSDPPCPAELPVEMNSLRSQQHRWAKGSIQTARKVLPALLLSRASFAVKAEAFIHLTNNVAYLLLFAVSLLLIPSLVVRRSMAWSFTLPDLLVFAAGTGSFALFCAASQRRERRTPAGGIAERWTAGRTLAAFPMVMALGAGLALNNALAVLEAIFGIPSEFRRTPKFRIGSPDERPRWQALSYRGDPTRLALVETFLCLLFLFGIFWAAREGLYASIPFLALFAAGNGYVAGLTFMQGVSMRLLHRRPAGAGSP